MQTMLKAGIKSNVLPNKATVTINHRYCSAGRQAGKARQRPKLRSSRINVGESSYDVLAHNIRVVNDLRVKFNVVLSDEPSPVSNCEADGFKMVERSVRQVRTITVLAKPVASLTKRSLPTCA